MIIEKENRRFAGIILCGGQSTRMGTAKAWLELDGQTFLERIVGTLSTVVQPLIVVASKDQKLPELNPACSLCVIHDTVGEQGPLHGIKRGLESLPDGVAGAFITSVDAPLLSKPWVHHFIEKLEEYDIVVARTDGHLHPLSAVYHKRVANMADNQLAGDNRRVVDLLDKCSTRFLEEPELREIDPGLDSLWNINTPIELEELRQRYGK